jgi:sterol desaturase/sphingolipid hydroxylase (fatty acid hydroxylase superfamily)
MTSLSAVSVDSLGTVLPAGNFAGGGFPFAGLALVLTLMLAEYLYGRLADHDTHDLKESASSLVVAIGYKISGMLTAGLLAIPMIWLHGFAPFDLPMSAWWTWPLLFLGIEFCYYWHHFAMHKVRWLWASHAVHHSATRLNFTAGVRLGWGAGLTGGILFYLPLPLIGFDPLAVGIMLAANLGYQFFLHPARAPDLGPLEWVLNTPRHHHVHHAANPECIDKNFGGTLIVFDRLFGTFARPPEHAPLRFGIAGVGHISNNPLRIVTFEWLRMVRDLKKTPRRWWKVLFGAPV